jgi:hypothetical protein
MILSHFLLKALTLLFECRVATSLGPEPELDK